MLRFTEAELAEMAAADAEIDRAPLTKEEYRRSADLDRDARLQRLDNRQRSIAARKKAYYEANREEIAARNKAYYEANREKIAARKKAYREANREEIAAYQKAYYEANREKYNAYMREYMRRRRLEKKYAQTHEGPADSAGRQAGEV